MTCGRMCLPSLALGCLSLACSPTDASRESPAPRPSPRAEAKTEQAPSRAEAPRDPLLAGPHPTKVWYEAASTERMAPPDSAAGGRQHTILRHEGGATTPAVQLFYDEQSQGRLLVDYEIIEPTLRDADAQLLIQHHFFAVLLGGGYRGGSNDVAFAAYGRERFDDSIEPELLGEDGRAEVQLD